MGQAVGQASSSDCALAIVQDVRIVTSTCSAGSSISTHSTASTTRHTATTTIVVHSSHSTGGAGGGIGTCCTHAHALVAFVEGQVVAVIAYHAFGSG